MSDTALCVGEQAWKEAWTPCLQESHNLLEDRDNLLGMKGGGEKNNFKDTNIKECLCLETSMARV